MPIRASSLPVPHAAQPEAIRPTSSLWTMSHDETGRAWATTVDDPWAPLILTCDGGGIRGYSSLLILKEIMHHVAEWENVFEAKEKPAHERKKYNEDELLPCHYFDFMYGTSTGGLIATMLARLRMPLNDCLKLYAEVGDKLFGEKRSKMPLATKYDHEPLEHAVKLIVKKYCPVQHGAGTDGCDWNPWVLDIGSPSAEEPFTADSPNRICQAICLTAVHNQNINTAYLLRTYNHQYNNTTPVFVTRYNEGADALKIWQVTRATSAAPFFFKALFADVCGEIKEFKDGGIRENNPSGAAWNEFVSLYGEDNNPAMLLSIGTGRPNMAKDGFESVWPGPFGRLSIVKKLVETFAVFKNMLVKYTEGESRHIDMCKLARGQHTWYKRLNVDKGLENMRLDNWEHSVEMDNSNPKHKKTVVGGKTLARIQAATTAYLAREQADATLMEYAAPKVMAQQIAEKLVRHRRARERTAEQAPDRWNTFMGRRLQRADPEPDAAAFTSASEPDATKSSSSSVNGQEDINQSWPAS